MLIKIYHISIKQRDQESIWTKMDEVNEKFRILLKEELYYMLW
jgi:hypothetical protein